MDVVAIVALGRNADDEAPVLAPDLGLTPYETGLLLRGPTPIVISRSDDRARTVALLGKLRARGHDAVACEMEAVVPSAEMFQPKSFRFEGAEIVGVGQGETRRLVLADVSAVIRATHITRSEEKTTTRERKIDLGRAAMSGGLLMTKTTTKESKKVVEDRETVLYVYGIDAAPWLVQSTQMRYDGLGPAMRPSKAENFEVFVRRLRELATSATFDARLAAARAVPNALTMTTSASATIDVLAHIIAMSLAKAARPYR